MGDIKDEIKDFFRDYKKPVDNKRLIKLLENKENAKMYLLLYNFILDNRRIIEVSEISNYLNFYNQKTRVKIFLFKDFNIFIERHKAYHYHKLLLKDISNFKEEYIKKALQVLKNE